MTLFRRLRNLWPGALRQQVTRTGLAYSIAVVLVALAAFLSANNLLFLILAAMLSVLFISGFVSKLGLAGLEIELLLPEHISARRKVRATVRLKNLKRWMPSFSIRVEGSPGSGFDSALYFPVLPGGAVVDEAVNLFFPSRGRLRERTFQFATRFPFGFAERREWVTMRQEILIYPCLDLQPGFEEMLASISGELEARQRGRGHDFYRIRPYEAFETAKHVDWKATAHTGNLQVREFARDEDQRVLLYLDLEVPDRLDDRSGSDWFESAVACAAVLASRLSERGTQVRLRTQEVDIRIPDDGDIYSILRYLALVSPLRGKPPGSPDAGADLHIVLSANPKRMAALGWGQGQSFGIVMLGPESFLTGAARYPGGEAIED
jgi:uncharacterized protein (DUF58 family)